MKPLTVFFDVGGTLLDAPDLFQYITGKLTNHSTDQKTYDLLIKIFGSQFPKEGQNHSFKRIEEMLAATLKILSEQHGYQNISDQAHEIYLDVFLHNSHTFPEVPSVLEKLHSARVKMIIASDADGESMEQQLVKFDLHQYFIDKCVSSLARAYKPSNGFISHLKKHIPEDKNSCYFVGDNSVDVESGKRLGIRSVLIDRKNSGKNFGADYIIHNLNELLPILGIDE